MAFGYEVMPEAERDLLSIEAYVYSYTLDLEAARRLNAEFVEVFRGMCKNPLWHPVYQFPESVRPAHEYRSVNVRNYKIFYRVDEARKIVLIYRIRHTASDFTSIEFESQTKSARHLLPSRCRAL